MNGLFDFFRDPRLRQERLFLYLFLPMLLLLAAVALYFLLGREYLASRAERKAQAPAAEVSSREPTPEPTPALSPSESLTEAAAAFARGDFSSARVLYTAALQGTDAEKADATYWLGTLSLIGGENEGAVEYFSQALAIDDTRPSPFLGRSEAFRRLKRHEEALADLRSARERDRTNPVYSNKILLARLESGDREAVIREVQSAIDLNVSQLRTDWLGGAAGIEIQGGNTAQAVKFLRDFRELVSEEEFILIVTDGFFQPYFREEEFSRLLPGGNR